MRPGWKEVQLSDYINVKHGYAFKGENFCDAPNNNLVVSPGNFSIGGGFFDGKRKYYDGEIPNEYILNTNDLIVTMTDLSKFSDTLGYSALVPNNPPFQYLHNQRIGLVEFLSDEIDREFLYWLMRTRKYQKYITSRASGSTVKHTSPSSITSYSFFCPSLPEQCAIAATLSCLDEKIELNNKINANLEAQAQAIFKSWFVDFEPWGGIMPEGWREGCLADVCNYCSDRVPVSTLSLNTYISTENMLPNKMGFVNATNLPTTSQVTSFKNGDILISNIRPYFKKIIYCDFDGGCSTDVLCFRASKSYASLFLYCTLYSDRFFDYMVAGSKGTKMPRGDKQQVMNYTFVIPNDETLSEFNSVISPLMKNKSLLTAESLCLAAIRDALLPKLMSGEIEVPFTE